MSKGRYYLAGPMRGYKLYNFPAFDKARDELTAVGYEIVSPADLDRQAGFDPSRDGWTHADQEMAVVRDVAAIADPETKGIILIDGWERSEGTWQEVVTTRYLRKEVLTYSKGKVMYQHLELPLSFQGYSDQLEVAYNYIDLSR